MKKVLAVLLILCMVVGLMPEITLPVAAASGGGTDISEMNALSALGIDTSQVPEGVDLDSMDNPYGRSTMTVNPVFELFVQGVSSSTLFGHNKALGKSWSDFYDTQGNTKNVAVTGSYAATATASGNFTKDAGGRTAQTVSVAAGSLNANGGLFLYFSDPVNNVKGDAKVLLGTDKIIGNTGNQMNEDFSADAYLMQNYLQIATGDFDGDGVDEVAVYVAQQGSSRVEIYDLQIDDTWTPANASAYYLNPNKWAKAWTYYFNESPYVSNMVSITSGDFNQDGIDDIALTWGYYYGLNNFTNSRAVILCGSKTSMLQKSMNIDLAYQSSQIVRAAFTYGDIDGDNVNDLILGGQLNSDILGGNLNSRFAAIYTYNGDTDKFIQTVAKNFDLFATEKNDAGEDVYLHPVMANHNKIFYSLPTMVANIAAVNMRGIGYASNIYLDSLILEYGDEGLDITAALDQDNRFNKYAGVNYPSWVRFFTVGRFYTEYGIVAADFTGDTAQTLQVMMHYSMESYRTKMTYSVPSYRSWWHKLWGIKSWSSIVEDLSFSLNGETVMAALQGVLTKSGSEYSFGVNIKTSTVDFATSFCKMNSDNDTSFVNYTGEHGVIYSDPQVFAVLASPPHFEDLGSDNLSGSYMESSTSYSKTKGSGSESTTSHTLSIGAYVSYEHDFEAPITGTKIAGFETELAYTHGWTWETAKSSMVEMTISYETVVGQDSVVFYSIPMEYYIYDSYMPIVNEATGEVAGYDLQKMSINLPHTAAVVVLSLEKYEQIAADYAELPQVAGTVLTHTIGRPSSYPSSSAAYSNVKEYDGNWAGVDYSAVGASVTQEIAITKENSSGLTHTNTIDFKIGAGPGNFIFGVTAGYEHGSSKVTITSEGSTYAGTIYNMPLEAQEYGYYYAWKLFTYTHTIGNNVIPVVSYMVKDVTSPPILPADFAQDNSLTTDEAIGLTWSYPAASAIAGFQIYRYYEFPDGSGSYELAFIPASDVSFVSTDSEDKVMRHYKYVDEGLADYTNYNYQIQVVRAAVPTSSIISDVLTARTKADKGYPTIALNGVTPIVTNIYDEETGDQVGTLTDYTLLVYPDTNSTVSVTIAEHYAQTPRYQWQKRSDEGWTSIIGATKASYTFSNSGLADEGEYRCRVNVIYEDEDVGQIYYISAYSDIFTLDYTMRQPKVNSFAVNVANKTVSLSLKSNHTNHTFAPSGNVTFTIANANYEASYTVALGSPIDYVTTATLNLASNVTLPDGVYEISAYYSGSRVFSSLAVSSPVYYVSGNSSGYLLNVGKSFTYGDPIAPKLMSVSVSGSEIIASQISDNVTYKLYEERPVVNHGSYTINWFWFTRTYTYTYITYEYVERPDFIVGGSITAKSVGSYTLKAFVNNNQVAIRNLTVTQRDITIGFQHPLSGVAGNGSIVHPTYTALKLNSGSLQFSDTLANLGLVVKAYNSAGNVVEINPSTDPGLYTIVGAAGNTAGTNYSNYNITYIPSTYILTGPKYDITLVSMLFGSDNAIVGTVGIIRPEIKEDNGSVINMTTTATNNSFYRDDTFTGGTDLTLRATAQTGYKVKSWTVTTDTTSAKTVTSLTTFPHRTTANNTTITVEFELAKNKLYFQSASKTTNDGTVNAVGNAIQSGAIVQPDAVYTFLATPKPGYHFVQWTLSGSTNSNFIGNYDAATGTSTTNLTMGNVNTTLSAIFERDSYTLTLPTNLQATYLVDDGFGNMVLRTSTGTVSILGDTTVTIAPKTGFSLTESAAWSINGVPVGAPGDPNCTIIMLSDAVVEVGSSQNTYSVSVSVSQPETTTNNKVTVRVDNALTDFSESRQVSGGKSLTFTAVEAWGYVFDHWEVNGTNSGTNKTISIAQLGADTDVLAVFKDNPGKYTVGVSNNSGGRLTYSVVYNKSGYYGNAPSNADITASGQNITVYAGDTVVITALPETNYMLRSFTVGNNVDESPECVLTLEAISSNVTVSARFIPMSFTKVTYIAESGGVITSAKSSGVSFNSGDSIGNGTTVLITALPDTDNMISHWTIDNHMVKTTDNTSFAGETLTIDKLEASDETTIKVYFTTLDEKEVIYTLANATVSKTYTPATYTGKTASSDTTDYVRSGSKAVISAAPDNGYRITSFTVNLVSGTENPDGTWSYTLNEVISNVNVVVIAEKLYSVAVGSLANGSIAINTMKEQHQAIAGETITLSTIAPALDYTFGGWSYNDITVDGTTFTMPAEDTTVSAIFSPISPVSFTYSVYDTNGAEPGGTNGTISVEITRAYSSGALVSGYPITDSSGNITINRGYTDTYVAWPNSVVTFNGVPDSGYIAKYWYLDGVEVTAATPNCAIVNNSLAMTVVEGAASSYTVEVQYELVGNKVTYSAANAYGTINNDAVLTTPHGETTIISSGHTLTIDGTITFTAAPINDNYKIEGWYVNGVKQDNETGETYTYTATAGNGAVVTVLFERVSYAVIFGGTNSIVTAQVHLSPISSPAIVVGDSMVTFTAVANPGYAFNGWVVNGVDSTETTATLTLTVTANTIVTATFREDENLLVTYSVIGSGGTLAATRGGVPFASGNLAAANNVITFIAMPETVANGGLNNYRVANWTVNGTTVQTSDTTRQITVSGPLAVSVTFERYDCVVEYNVTGDENGTITAVAGSTQLTSMNRVVIGQNVVFTAQPAEGYQVKAWVINHVTTPTENTTYTISNLAADTTAAVEFEPIPTYTITITTSGTGYGSVTAKVGNGEAVPNATSVSVPRYGAVILTAMRFDASNAFNGWSIPVNAASIAQANGIVLTLSGVTEDLTIGAAFTPATMIELSAFENDPNGALNLGSVKVGYLSANLMSNVNLSTSSTVQITSGMDVVITAAPNSDHMVQKWIVNGQVQDELSKTLTLYNVRLDTAIEVTFEPLVTRDIPSNGSQTNGGYYTVTPGAKVPSDVGSDSEIRDRGTITFTVEANPGSFFTDLDIFGVDCLVETGSDDGTTQNIVSVVGQGGSYTITVANVIANVEHNIRAVKPIIDIETPTNGAIEVSYVHESSGPQIVTSGDEVPVGAQLTITATPETGYFLKSWGDDVSTKTGAQIYLTVTESELITISAEFALPTISVVRPANGSIAVTYKDINDDIVTLADTGTAPQGTQQVTFAIPAGTELTVTASPNSGYYLSSWGGAAAGKPGREILLTVPGQDISISAVFFYSSGGGGFPFVPQPQNPTPQPPAPPVTPTPEPQTPHRITITSPDGSVTQVDLECETGFTDDGRALERISVPASFVDAILADKEAGSEKVDITIGDFAVDEGSRQPVVLVTLSAEVITASSGMTLNLKTPHGTLSLPPQLVETLASLQQSLSVTIDRQPAETVRELLPVGTEPVGEALSIETQLRGPTKVTIGINTELSEDEDIRMAFLAELMTFAIHSNGTQEMIYDVTYDILETPYTDEQGNERIRYTLSNVSFGVNEFSRFIVVKSNLAHLSLTVGVPGFTIGGESRDMVACYYKGNDTMMPIRMLEDFGVSFSWNEDTKTATMRYKQQVVVLTIGSTEAYINGVKTPIVGASGALVAPELAPGRTMIPLRFVSEHLGLTVTWDPSNLITIRLGQ